jgi:hypothetical protein
MKNYHIADRPTPLPASQAFLKSLMHDRGPTDTNDQKRLERQMGLSYRSGVGQLSHAMVCCRPDLSYAVMKLAQASICPSKAHFDGVRHVLKYMYQTRMEGLHYWRTQPQQDLPTGPLPTVLSNKGDLLPQGRPSHAALDAHGFSDEDWAACPLTRRSMTGVCIKLAGSVIAYKTALQRTIATSSAELEFMAAYDLGKMCLCIRSVLWDLNVLLEAATHIHEDNDACTSMANAQKTSPRTRHMDI